MKNLCNLDNGVCNLDARLQITGVSAFILFIWHGLSNHLFCNLFGGMHPLIRKFTIEFMKLRDYEITRNYIYLSNYEITRLRN